MESTGGNSLCQCSYCGNYHNYSSEMCKAMNRIEVRKIELSTQPPMIMIPDYKDKLQKIIYLLQEIKLLLDLRMPR